MALATALFFAGCSAEYDDTEVWNSITSLEQRVSAVETVTNAYKNNLFIESVTQVENGYVIKFSDGSTATITNGKDGADGKDGKDGVDGKDGANGKDGVDGTNGKDGVNGTDGKDGANGKDGQNGADGKDGVDGKDGDTLIASITVGEEEVTFVLTDGTTFSIPLYTMLKVTFDAEDLVVVSPKSTVEVAYTVTSSTGSAVVEVVSSADLKAKVVAGADGLSGNILITVGESVDEYSKVVVFVTNGDKVVMKALAFEAAGLKVEEDVVKSVPATGGELTLEFLSNTACEVVIPEEAQSWISVAPETRALEKQTIVLAVSANTGDARQAVVAVQSKDGSLKVEYTVAQKSAFSTIEEIIAAGVGAYSVKDAWVAATYGRGFLATDASGKYILCYQGADATIPAVGTVVNIEGSVTSYAGLLQFGTGAIITTSEQSVSVELGTPEALAAADLDAYLTAPEVKYATFEGTLSISGYYYNVAIEGATTAIGSLSYPTGDIATALAELDGKAIKVTGFMIGASSGKYTNMMVTAVEALGGDVTPEPEPSATLPEIDTEAYYTFQLAETFEAGKWYALVADNMAAQGLSSNYGYLKVTEVTPVNNTISLPATHAFGFLAVEGGYTIQQYNGKYVYQSGSYNSFNVSASLPTEGLAWSVDYAASVATITNVEKAKFIQFDTQYTSYGSYDTEKGVKPALYELVEVDTTPRIVSVGAEKLSFVADGESKELAVETYGTATLTATSDVDWATATISGNTITITVAANDVEQSREGKLTIAYADATATVELLQAAKPAAGEVEPTTAAIDFSAQGYSNAQSVDGIEIKVDDNVTVVFAKSSSSAAPAYYTASNGIRMYQNGATLEVTANGKTITSIEFAFDNNMWYIGADSGSLSEEGEVRTWTGEATAVKFTSTGTDKSHRAYVKTLKVTYK